MLNNTIISITLNDCLLLRHQVLWPHLTEQECIDKEDNNSTHIGYFQNNKIISCLTLTPKTAIHYRIRKFATHPSFQRQGIGSKLFTTVLTRLKKNQIEFVSLNARNTAINFYNKFNFCISGEQFSNKNVLFTPMQLTLKDFEETIL